MALVKEKVGQHSYKTIKKQNTQTLDPARERDITSLKELDYYENKKKRIKTLVGDKKERTERMNEKTRREYTTRR
jgi:hypothetical protein